MASKGSERRRPTRLCSPAKAHPPLKGSRATRTTTPLISKTKTVSKNDKKRDSKEPKRKKQKKGETSAKTTDDEEPHGDDDENSDDDTNSQHPLRGRDDRKDKKQYIQDSDNDEGQGEDVLAESDSDKDDLPLTQSSSTHESPSTRSSSKHALSTKKPDTAARRKTHGTPKSQTRESVSPTPLSKSKETPAQKRKRAKLQVDRLSANGWNKWINSMTRAAVFDARPFGKDGIVKHQHLYWAKEPELACVMNLMRREDELRKEAMSYKGKNEFEQKISKQVKESSRKARNKHINELRAMFFKDKSPFQICENVAENDYKDEDDTIIPMKINPRLAPTLTSVQDMRDLLMSDKFRLDKTFYENFVAAMQAGKFCQVRSQPKRASLPSFLSVLYEAHYRLELWYALSKQGKLKMH